MSQKKLSCLLSILILSQLAPLDANKLRVNETWSVDRLADYMDVLCPYETICRSGEPRLQSEPDRGWQSCCIGCSCDESCGLTQTCCFPDLDVHTTVDQSHRECVAASSRVEDGQPRRDYYMIVDGQQGGTREDCGNDKTACGDKDDATPLGSLYPVSSRATGLIYKNTECALCHGVNKSEQVPWNAVLVCDRSDISATNMDIFFQALESGIPHAFCKFEFYYPASQTDVDALACYENTKHGCKSIGSSYSYIPDNLNMTEEEVWAACVSDLFAPYDKHYYNAFCYICNYERNSADSQCRIPEPGIKAPKAQDVTSYSAFIDIKFVEEKSRVTSEETNLQPKTACRIHKEHSTDTSDCRPVLCPSGQVRFGPSCVFPSQRLLSTQCMLVVKLYPRDVIHTSSIKTLKRLLRDGLSWRTVIPVRGLKSWDLEGFSYNDTLDDVRGSIIGYLCVKLYTVRSNSNLKTIVANVRTIMKKDWTLHINDHDVLFHPQFFEFQNHKKGEENKTIASWNEIINNNLPPFAKYLFMPSLKLITDMNFITKYPPITKMMFCDQIALDKNEYQLDSERRRLYYNATDRLFFPLEFSLGYDRNSEFIPKLCLEDAGFVVHPGAASAVSVTALESMKLTIVPCLLSLRSLLQN